MIKNKRETILLIATFLAILALAGILAVTKRPNSGVQETIIHPVVGDVALTVTTTGIVEPQNRLEIKPSISGRVEEILVDEGDRVKTGDVLAWMSSTERAALVDAARAQGEQVLKYWEDVYKKTPIVSPIDGEVIVRSVEPGQTVTTADPILVLSDRLVVNAQFDETDIGRVKTGQKAFITLDAYPDVKLGGTVDHIAYESKIVNNVTTYDVDVLPEGIPEVLRSGMSVTVEVVEKESNNVMTIPSSAIHYDKKRQFVLLKNRFGRVVEQDITVGLNNEKTAEVVSGLTALDGILVQENLSLPPQKRLSSSPFMPFERKKK